MLRREGGGGGGGGGVTGNKCAEGHRFDSWQENSENKYFSIALSYFYQI